ncbi:hypothetical protein [Dermatophilus congolensis]|uniref:Uncharacterized protein n=1 Tax=Dermatophilus congolensis TaxID=1863 RepID=A0A239V4E2_9MICO|nr:hypothetical protein [Dermatophilus congolensis]MBO3130157.1 hypothetical protein [Dermatophilus congolensis]MBO3131216.1 hypothetical protein [Dermatophilus congolensis]MBO3134628.1 hypothetical protein [Dermatophilus congolensis]MBO3136865.1 hypothetical protein [Dermatophilus congolensis]MBO3139109.1 hypothetical protein [Dermatophilus congolensis]
MSNVREPRRDEALPGELKPLDWYEGRGPITDGEALGVLRRRRRVELAGVPKSRGKRAGVPEELPPAVGPKKASVFRLPERTMAFAHARAELERVPLTTVIEEMLRDYATSAPQSPQDVEARLTRKDIKWQRR